MSPKAFSNPAYGEFGKGPGRLEELRSFGAAYEDLGLMKGFSVGRVRAQLRLELLNLFNRHYFSDPITNIGSPQFGQVISTSGSPRTGQVSVRLDWKTADVSPPGGRPQWPAPFSFCERPNGHVDHLEGEAGRLESRRRSEACP